MDNQRSKHVENSKSNQRESANALRPTGTSSNTSATQMQSNGADTGQNTNSESSKQPGSTSSVLERVVDGARVAQGPSLGSKDQPGHVSNNRNHPANVQDSNRGSSTHVEDSATTRGSTSTTHPIASDATHGDSLNDHEDIELHSNPESEEAQAMRANILHLEKPFHNLKKPFDEEGNNTSASRAKRRAL